MSKPPTEVTSDRRPHPRALPGRPACRPAQRHPCQSRHRPRHRRRRGRARRARHRAGTRRRQDSRPLPPSPSRPSEGHRLGRRGRPRRAPRPGRAGHRRRPVAADRWRHGHGQDVPGVRRHPYPARPRGPSALGSDHHRRLPRAPAPPRRPRRRAGPADPGALPAAVPGRPRRGQDQRMDRGADLPAHQPPVRAHAPHPHHHQPSDGATARRPR